MTIQTVILGYACMGKRREDDLSAQAMLATISSLNWMRTLLQKQRLRGERRATSD